jgi:hypothetical protein
MRAKMTQDAHKSRPMSPLQTPSFNMSSTGGSLLRKAMKLVVGDKTTFGDKATVGDKATSAERNEFDALKEAAILVARRRGLPVDVFVKGLMALLDSEGVESRTPENPFDDPVVQSVDSEGFQHVSSGASEDASPGLMSVPECGGSTQVASRVDAKPPRQSTSMSGTWAGMRNTNEEERRNSRCSVLTAIRRPSTEMVASSTKGPLRGWMERLSGAKAAGARVKRD